MHFVDAKSILSAKGVIGSNGMNIYRGCLHGCIYCDSRAEVYQINHPFEDVAVKQNAITLLEDALQRKRNKCMIGTGSMSDPYIPIEKDLKYTRKALEVIAKHQFGVSLITKSNLVLRDVDVLTQINEQSKCAIQISMTIADDALSKIIEPNVIPTSKRYEVLKAFQSVGIPTVVWLCPFLPFLTDTKENLTALLHMCKDAGVKGIICFGIGMTLRKGNREYFYHQLDRHFPGLKEKYMYTYGQAYQLTSKNNDVLMKYFHSFCEDNGIMHNNDQIFHYLNTYESKTKIEQLNLF